MLDFAVPPPKKPISLRTLRDPWTHPALKRIKVPTKTTDSNGNINYSTYALARMARPTMLTAHPHRPRSVTPAPTETDDSDESDETEPTPTLIVKLKRNPTSSATSSSENATTTPTETEKIDDVQLDASSRGEKRAASEVIVSPSPARRQRSWT
jgi:hypothetical protein